MTISLVEFPILKDVFTAHYEILLMGFPFFIHLLKNINKPVLLHISALFNCKFIPHSVQDVYDLRVEGVWNIDKVVEYFNAQNLYTKKARSYTLWLEVIESLKNREHLSLYPDSRKALKVKPQMINNLLSLH